MIITLKQNAAQTEVSRLRSELEAQGFVIHPVEGTRYNILGLIGDTASLDARQIESLDFVDKVTRIQEPYKKANRKFHPDDSVINVGGALIGGGHFAVMAGPCSVETPEQVLETAKACKEAGATILRGGAFKPRTSPYSFQGMGPEGLELLELAKKETGLPIVSEVMDISQLQYFDNVDMLQIGARNMQNFDLLKAVGKTKKPILLKRGMSATIQEWIMAAEYIMSEGNPNVIFCERGIRTFETYTRNTLDLSVVPIIKERTHLPIIIDPSHAAGDYKLIESLSLAAIAAGADGLIIEVHDDPENAWSDGAQSLKPKRYADLVEKGKAIAKVIGREL